MGYETRIVPLPDSIRKELTEIAQSQKPSISKRIISSSVVFVTLLAISYPIVALSIGIDLTDFQALFSRPFGYILLALWFAFVLMSLYLLRLEREAHARVVAEVSKELEDGQAIEHELVFEDRHLFAGHQQGIYVFADTGDDSTLFLNLSCSSFDPRWSSLEKETRVPNQWRWVTSNKSGRILQFHAEGDSFEPIHIEEVTGKRSDKTSNKLVKALDNPADISVIENTLESIVALAKKC